MSPETRAELVALVEDQIKSAGTPKIKAANLRLTLETLIYSLVAILDDANVAGGYPTLNDDVKIDLDKLAYPSPASGLILYDDGVFAEKNTVFKSGTNVTLDPSYAAFVYTAAGSTWITMQVRGNKTYSLVNRGSGALTLNYPGGQSKIIDIASGGAVVNTITISANRLVTIVDDGTYLIMTIS